MSVQKQTEMLRAFIEDSHIHLPYNSTVEINVMPSSTVLLMFYS